MAQNSREKSRRHLERRSTENRKIKHAFGSPEWIEEIRKHYSMWPKQDRRTEDRRDQDRRTQDRRDTIRVDNTSSKKLARKGVGLLSDEEKKMLNELTSPKKR
ncbi:MAG: hypothetical protein COA83_04750 [Methylophaga sp.]|nr:MAG: hypothetical protein COA83_04750 [Methylophaga sp.]